jgi:ComF family protein
MGVMLMAGRQLSTEIFPRVNKWIKYGHDWLLPPVCVLCGRAGSEGHDICHACAAELPWLQNGCRRCAIPLPQEGICGACLKKPPAFDSAFAAFEYDAPADSLIQGLKFNARLYNARLLGEVMARRLQECGVERPQLLIPVPLHARRLRERGFNQALELARPLARTLELPLRPEICRRLRATPPQTGLDAKARRRNLKGVFEVKPIAGISHVAIVDDVMTTGSTVGAMARALKRAGVARVDVWICARAPLQG